MKHTRILLFIALFASVALAFPQFSFAAPEDEIDLLKRGASSVPTAGSSLLNTGREIFGGVLDVGATLGGVPVNDHYSNLLKSKEIAAKIAEKSADGLLWMAVNHIISTMTSSVVRWINTGFEGSPAFITNPEAFFADTLDQVTGLYINELGLTNTLCRPFSLQIRVALLNNYVRTTVPRYACTLDTVAGNVEGFFNNFQNGGWKTWISLAQEQNDPYMQYLHAYDDLAQRRAGAFASKEREANWGNGFLSFRDSEGKITTPGAVIESQLNNALDSTNRRLQVADQFNEIAGALIGQLLDKTLTAAGGLIGLTQDGNRSNNYLASVQASVANEQAQVRTDTSSLIDTDLLNEQNFVDIKKETLFRTLQTQVKIPPVVECLATATSTASVSSLPFIQGVGTPLTLEEVVLAAQASTRELIVNIENATTSLAATIASANKNIETLTLFKAQAAAASNDIAFAQTINDYQLFRTQIYGTTGVETAQTEKVNLEARLATVDAGIDRLLNACRSGTLVQLAQQL